MNIVVLDGYNANPGDISWSQLASQGQLTVYDRTEPALVVERCREADIVLTNKVVLSAEVMAQLPQLKYVGVLATGYNVVDVKAAAARSIVVTNVPAYSTDSVAQLVFAHLLNLTNSVDHYARQNREGRWSQSADFSYADTPLSELAGKTMGIVGLGHIGMKVATIALAFGMDVFAVTSKHRTELPVGMQKTTFEGLLGVSDVLTLHCPLNEQTRAMINRDTLACMKEGAVLINTGRGPLVDEQAVVEALNSRHLGAYCADVLCQEPPLADHPLLASPHAYITPHVAWATLEARQRLLQVAADNVQAFIEGHPQNVVA